MRPLLGWLVGTVGVGRNSGLEEIWKFASVPVQKYKLQNTKYKYNAMQIKIQIIGWWVGVGRNAELE